ncbi:MAG: M6 family metalloprotease domain-containing protein, partial [Candidatus Marinimicrobia bacterium]|nr:M6 family metalloprotease domain-containing protein [Candidatus Neomarinimicrobiota bacterium]
MSNQLFDTYKTFSTGSMKKYYDEVSYGQFDFNGEILTDDWIKVSRPSSYWNIGSTSIAPELIREALDLIDDYTDFRKFDLDGVDGIPNSGDDDGTVDNLIAIHSGVGGESGGQEIWSHSWSLSPAYVTDDIGADGSPIIISGYVIQPATTTTNQMEGIEVFCHEFGHALGLPDLYDRDDSPDEESEGVGEWCIMSANTSHDESPAHFSAWCKEVLGWVNPIILDRNMYDVEIPPVEKSGVVYKVWTKGQIDPYTFNWGGKTSVPVGREYFLIENRQKLNFDKELPGEGLLIWHVRNDVTRQNDDENYKLVDLEAADNRFDLDSGRNNGDDGDPFPGSTQNNSFNRISYPNSNSFYDDLSKVAIENITMNDTLIYADLHIFAPDLEYRGNSIDDSSGDENGFVDPGETVDISLTLKNFGADLASMTFTLSISDTAVFIIDSISIYKDILHDTEVAETDDK